jgi:CRP-like cAMP-binding protein
VIRAGIAMKYVVLPDGHRQVLAFLMPGDPISAAAFFQPYLQYSVQAITQLRYCSYDRRKVASSMRESAPALEAFCRQMAAELSAGHEWLIDRARKGADTRVARLLLGIIERQVHSPGSAVATFDFPYTQQQIADAVGLTQTHVGRVISKLKKYRVIKLGDGVLTLLDGKRLKEISEFGGLDD